MRLGVDQAADARSEIHAEVEAREVRHHAVREIRAIPVAVVLLGLQAEHLVAICRPPSPSGSSSRLPSSAP